MSVRLVSGSGASRAEPLLKTGRAEMKAALCGGMKRFHVGGAAIEAANMADESRVGEASHRCAEVDRGAGGWAVNIHKEWLRWSPRPESPFPGVRGAPGMTRVLPDDLRCRILSPSSSPFVIMKRSTERGSDSRSSTGEGSSWQKAGAPVLCREWADSRRNEPINAGCGISRSWPRRL